MYQWMTILSAMTPPIAALTAAIHVGSKAKATIVIVRDTRVAKGTPSCSKATLRAAGWLLEHGCRRLAPPLQRSGSNPPPPRGPSHPPFGARHRPRRSGRSVERAASTP
jgi:hypothetical protein